jgi:DNA-binding beta-propeller fold protein YncE
MFGGRVRTTLATTAFAAVAFLCGCASSSTPVDAGGSQSLYILVANDESTMLFEYGPGDEHPRSERHVGAISDPWMDASGDLYVRRSSEGLYRYDARTWAPTRVFAGDIDGYVVGPGGALYVTLEGRVEMVAAGSHTAVVVQRRRSAAWSAIAMDARGRAYVASMPDGHIDVYDDLRKPPIRTIAAPRGLRAVALDARGRLFGLGDTGDELYEYADAMSQPIVVTTGLTNARALAFDPAGHIYVMNQAGYTNDGNVEQAGSIVEYAFGDESPFRTLDVATPDGIAIDAKGDLYVQRFEMGRADMLALCVYGPEGTEPLRKFTSTQGQLFFGPSTAT